MWRNVFERLRICIIHKLNGLTPQEVLLRDKNPFKAYVALPEKFSARMLLRDGEVYPQELIQQQLSYHIADALVDKGYINFSSNQRDSIAPVELRAELWVVRREE